MGNDVVNAVREFFITSKMPADLNNTNIALIPEVDSPTLVKHFRPISLCNVVYKIIAKILADRVKGSLNKIICPTQAAFVAGRSIQDNTILIQEVMHTLKRKKGKGELMAIKIDLEKAYDKMDWSFIRDVLLRFGYPTTWVNWVWECLSTVSLAVVVNGFVQP